MFSKTLILAFGTALVVAGPIAPRNAPTVVSDLHVISTQVASMSSAIQAYTGGLAAAIPIESAAITLENDITTAIDDTNNSGVFVESGSNNVTVALQSIEPLIESTLSLLVSKEPLSKAAGLNSVVLTDLQDLKNLTDQLATALESKTTTANASTIASGQVAIDSAFASAIAAFS